MSRPARSLEREQLAEAIEHLRALTDELARYREARDRIDPMWGVITRAEQAVKEAQEREPARIAATAFGKVWSEPSVKEAEKASAEAREARATAKEQIAYLDRGIEDLERQIASAQRRLPVAVAAVVRSDRSVAKLLGDFAEVNKRYVDLFGALQYLNSMLPAEAEDWYRTEGLPSPERTRWQAAVAALSRDADAELPA